MYELGRHIILDLEGCDRKILGNTRKIRLAMRIAAKRSGATIVKVSFHQFDPGVSGMIIISESHLSIHTWPEHGFAAVDIFTCGDLDTKAAAKYLAKRLDAKKSSIKTLRRGRSKKKRLHKLT